MLRCLQQARGDVGACESRKRRDGHACVGYLGGKNLCTRAYGKHVQRRAGRIRRGTLCACVRVRMCDGRLAWGGAGRATATNTTTTATTTTTDNAATNTAVHPDCAPTASCCCCRRQSGRACCRCRFFRRQRRRQR
ncbi:hypothetical protein FOA52_011289 [Chlamydomonas sp. UWO 241]|nr:hypothetical protein FOA52_011289 [Chlamydomonas sp. UWO 241]